jgi:hypothetical protein
MEGGGLVRRVVHTNRGCTLSGTCLYLTLSEHPPFFVPLLPRSVVPLYMARGTTAGSAGWPSTPGTSLTSACMPHTHISHNHNHITCALAHAWSQLYFDAGRRMMRVQA